MKIQGTKEEAFELVKNAGIVILFWRRSYCFKSHQGNLMW